MLASTPAPVRVCRVIMTHPLLLAATGHGGRGVRCSGPTLTMINGWVTACSLSKAMHSLWKATKFMLAGIVPTCMVSIGLVWPALLPCIAFSGNVWATAGDCIPRRCQFTWTGCHQVHRESSVSPRVCSHGPQRTPMRWMVNGSFTKKIGGRTGLRRCLFPLD